MTKRTQLGLLSLLLLLVTTVPLAAQDTTEFLLRWQRSPEADVIEYVIYRSLYPHTQFEPIDSVGVNTLEYTDTQREKGTLYYYKICAKNDSGMMSPRSNPVSGLTIPQDANDSMKNLCRITSVTDNGSGGYEVTWSTLNSSIGFVQYTADDEFDEMSAVDNNSSTSHTITLAGLLAPRTYYLRAVAYDDTENMYISAVDTLIITNEGPVAPTAPPLNIYPVPYHPGMGELQLTNMPPNGSVSIYSENGIEVWHENNGMETSLTWNGVNTQGSQVMSGVYYVIVKDATGSIVVKRPIMIVNV